MATERVTDSGDRSRRERIVEGDGEATHAGRGGAGIGGVIIGMAVLALVAIVAFFLLNQTRDDRLRASAVSGPAAAVAGSPSNLAKDVGDAAGVATDQATR